MRIINLSQQSGDWLFWRNGGIGGSDVGVIVGAVPKNWGTREGLLRSKRAHRGKLRTTDKNKSPAMMRGIELEPKVRQDYNSLMGRQAVPICCVHDELDFIRASLDGWDETVRDGLVVEIKCPNDGDHGTALGGTVPSKYWPQVQHQLLVTGAKRLHYVSFSDRPRWRPEEQLKVVPVSPSVEYMDFLRVEETKFWQELTESLK